MASSLGERLLWIQNSGEGNKETIPLWWKFVDNREKESVERHDKLCSEVIHDKNPTSFPKSGQNPNLINKSLIKRNKFSIENSRKF